MSLCYVYMMTNKSHQVLYIGVTDNIDERINEHKHKLYPNSFTAKYNSDKLVYFEERAEGLEASIKEKQLKKRKREWKINLIENMNASWMDLSSNWNINNRLRQ